MPRTASSDLRPDRAHREAEHPASSTVVDDEQHDRDAGAMASTHVQRRADRAVRPAADELERHVHGREGLALGHLEGRTTPDEETAQGDDERRDAAVRDEEPLEGPDGGPEGEREGDRDDPDRGIAQAEDVGQVLRLRARPSSCR